MRRRVDDRQVREFLGTLEGGATSGVQADEPSPVRALMEAYQLAQRTRTNQSWDPRPVSGNAAIHEATPLGMARVRDLIRNNPQFHGALGTFVDIVIGTGLQAYAYPFEPQIDMDAVHDVDLIYAWESDLWFRRWADDPDQADWEGRKSWWDMQRLAFGESIGVGDGLLLRCQRRKPGRFVPFCLQVIEREQLDRTKDRAAQGKFNKIVNGLEYDRDNRLVGAWVFDAHPEDHLYSAALGDHSSFVPASRIIHAYIPDRPSSDVGFTRFASGAATSRDRHWLVGSELTKAAIGALLTIVHYSTEYGKGQGLSLDGYEDIDGHPTPHSDVRMAQGGITSEVPAGDKVEMFSPNTPPQQLPGFIDVLDHDVAAGLRLSHLRLTGRWSKLSYTAGRGAQLDDEMHCAPLKAWWANTVVLPVRRAVNAQMAVLPHRGRARFSSLPAAEFLADELRFQEFLLVGAGREMLDPEGETDAALAKMRSGLSTLIIEAGKTGRHWLDLLMQARQVNHVASRLGVTLDFSKGQGGQREQTNGASENQDQPEEATQ